MIRIVLIGLISGMFFVQSSFDFCVCSDCSLA